MTRIAFVVPVYKRFDIARVCLRQLRRTCDALGLYGIHASAFVVGDDRNLRVARELGFGTVRRNNRFLGRKFNDGIQLAADPDCNPAPADYVMPVGSDDWFDFRILHRALPEPDEVRCFRNLSFVNPEGSELSYRLADNRGGCGLRIYPRQVLAKVGYRPAAEDRNRGIDSSVMGGLDGVSFRLTYGNIDPRQIVDWKSSTTQINKYDKVAWRASERQEPFSALAGFYPPQSLAEMRALFT